MIWIISAVSVFLFFFFYKKYTWRVLPWPSGSMKPSVVQCHRGYWVSGIRENTLAAFREAKAKGYEMVEMDVMLSGDLVPIVFHDDDLVRITGLPNKVKDCLAEELNQWVSAPTLEQVLIDEDVPKLLNIELKTNSIFSGTLEKKVSEVVLKLNVSHRVMFSSFNPFSIWRLSRLLPDIPRALLSTDQVEPGNSLYLRQMWLAPFIKLHALHLDASSMTPERLRYWGTRGVPVALWTVNDGDKARAFIETGAISIITDSLRDIDVSPK